MANKTIRTGTLYRTDTLDRSDLDEDARTLTMAFASETGYERFFGIEILDHNPTSVRLGRLNDGGPLLMDHDTRDHVGVVEHATVDRDGKSRAIVRFGRGARAEEIYRDVVDGIRRHVSVGYKIHEMTLEKSSDDGPDTYRVNDWEPLEVSLVSVPADHSVGIARADDNSQTHETIIRGSAIMPDANVPKDKPGQAPAPQPKIDINAEREAIRSAELARMGDIETLAREFGQDDLGRKAIKSGQSVDEFRGDLLVEIGKAKPAGNPDLGLSSREVRRFSFVRAINALANPTDRRAQQAAAFEFECSAEFAQKNSREARGILIPSDVLRGAFAQRDLTVGTDGAGGYTVGTDLMGEDFIGTLNNLAAVMPRATQFTDLVGNFAVPRQTGGVTAYWVAEGAAPTEGAATFDQVTMSPETVAAYLDLSRKLLIQSSQDIENWTRRELALRLGLALDAACINGSGVSNQPTGILNVSGIGDVAGGDNGLAPSWAHVVNLESEVANDNAAVGDLAYLTNTKVRGKLKTVDKASGAAQFVWGDDLNGYTNTIVTNQVPSTLTKGTADSICSAIIFGNFRDLIVGLWSGLDLNIDTASLSTTGGVRVVAMQDADVAVRHAESFAAMQDALTT